MGVTSNGKNNYNESRDKYLRRTYKTGKNDNS